MLGPIPRRSPAPSRRRASWTITSMVWVNGESTLTRNEIGRATSSAAPLAFRKA